MSFYTLFDTTIGRCGAAWNSAGFAGVQLPEKTDTDTRTRLLRFNPTAEEETPKGAIRRGVEEIQSLLEGKKKSLRALQLDMRGIADFHARVYETARIIPPGKTRTYGEIARAIGQPHAARAVGQALGRNPFAIVVPCHRVIGADGRMIGFSANGGIGVKLRLLEIEGAITQLDLFSVQD